MRFYPNQHRHTCGVDLHGRNLYLCILDQQGEIRLHKRLRCDPELFLHAIAPYRDEPGASDGDGVDRASIECDRIFDAGPFDMWPNRCGDSRCRRCRCNRIC